MPRWDDGGFWIRFVVATLATWRVTHLIAREDGPWDVVVRLRARAGSGFWGALLDCFYCLSMWIAVPFTAVVTTRIGEAAATWLAVSGAACLLERATAPAVEMQPLPMEPPPIKDEALLNTDRGGDDVLWTETSTGGDDHGGDRAGATDPPHAGGAVSAASGAR